MSRLVGLGRKLSGGKTATAVFFLQQDFEQGNKIIANIPLKIPGAIYMPSEQLVDFIVENKRKLSEDDYQKLIEEKFRDSSILIDEAKGLFSARRSMTNLAEITTDFIMLLGKLDCNFYYTFQIFSSQVDLQLRDITDNICICTRENLDGTPFVGKRIPNVPIRIHVKVYEFDINFNLIDTGIEFYFDPLIVAPLYNTRQFTIMDREKFKVK